MEKIRNEMKLIFEIENCLTQLPFQVENEDQKIASFYGFPNEKVYAIFYKPDYDYVLMGCSDLEFDYEYQILYLKKDKGVKITVTKTDLENLWYIRSLGFLIKTAHSFNEVKEYLNTLPDK